MIYLRASVAILAVLCLALGLQPRDSSRALDMFQQSSVVTTSNDFARELERVVPRAHTFEALVYTLPGVGGTRDVHSSVTINGGQTWSDSLNISSDDLDSNAISAISEGNNVYAGWESYDPAVSSDVAFFARSTNGAASWSQPVRLSGDTGGGGISLATINDDLFAVYKSDGGVAPADLFVRHSSTFGQEFDEAIKIGEQVRSAQAAAAGGDLYVAYLAADGGPAVLTFPGGDLSGGGITSTFDLDAFSYRIDIDPDGEPTVTMQGSQNGGPATIYHAYLAEGAWVLHPIEETPPNALGIGLPDVSFSSTRTWFSWPTVYSGGPATVSVAAFIRATAEVSASLEFSEPGELYVDPSILANGERLYVGMTSAPEGAEIGEEAIEIWGLPANANPPTTTEGLPYAGTLDGAALPDLGRCEFPLKGSGGIAEDFFEVCITFVEFANQGTEVSILFARGAIHGDADCSPPSTSAADALAILREVAGLDTPPCDHSKDTNCDGAVNALDALILQRAVASLQNAVREGCSAIGW